MNFLECRLINAVKQAQIPSTMKMTPDFVSIELPELFVHFLAAEPIVNHEYDRVRRESEETVIRYCQSFYDFSEHVLIHFKVM